MTMSKWSAYLIALTWFATTHAQMPEDFDFHFEISHIIGTVNSIIIHRAPVMNRETGEINLKDITVNFSIGDNGEVTVNSLVSNDSVSLPNSASNFIPGIYENSIGERYIVSVGGTTSDGRSAGSIRSDPGRNSFNASWVTGPVNGHPLIGTTQIAAELISGPIYGLIGVSNLQVFCTGRLAAFAQIGESITITAYHQPGSATGSCLNFAPDSNPNTTFGLASLTLTRVAEDKTN